MYAQVEMFGYIEKLKPLLTLTKSSPVHIPVWSLKRSTYAIIFVYIYSYPHPVYCWQPLVYIALVLPVDEEWMVEWVGIHVDTVLCQVIHFFLELCHSCGWFLSLVRDPFQFYWPSINMIAIFCIKAPVIRVAEFSSGKWEKKGLTRWMSILLRLGTSVPVRKGNSCFCVSIKWD